MAELSIDWMMVRDGERTLVCQNCTSWDRTTILAVLSHDPRNFEELTIAWSRYRSEPLTDFNWFELDELMQPPAGWVWLDLAHQQFAFFDTDPEDADELTPGAYCDTSNPDDKQYVWLNVPPWWRRLQVTCYSNLLEVNQLAISHWLPPLDFREVLFGREMAGEIAKQVLAIRWPVTPPTTAKEGSGSQARRSWFKHKRLSKTKGNRIRKLIKRVHVKWLMTPRQSLGGRIPREFLHWNREWKDREMDYRRAQWSRLREAPPAVPLTSQQFLYGPMGTEEVVMYFDLVRDLIMAAWRWVDDDRRITINKLTDDLLLYIDGWLGSPNPDEGSGLTVQEIINLERSLMPRIANFEILDCDCPLCRLQANTDLFGPGFSMADGHHLELEDEFAFSLEADRDMWESMRTDICCVQDEDNDQAIRQSKTKRTSRSKMSAVNMSVSVGDGQRKEMEEDDERIWTSSHVSSNPAPPELSLFAIGARLAELIERLKALESPRRMIDDLNYGFDEMSKVIRDFVADKITGASEDTASLGQAVSYMTAVLEACAKTIPEITPQSADLQSLVHEWQRQLTTRVP